VVLVVVTVVVEPVDMWATRCSGLSTCPQAVAPSPSTHPLVFYQQRWKQQSVLVY
jgi:hypothetical protein